MLAAATTPTFGSPAYYDIEIDWLLSNAVEPTERHNRTLTLLVARNKVARAYGEPVRGWPTIMLRYPEQARIDP